MEMTRALGYNSAMTHTTPAPAAPRPQPAGDGFAGGRLESLALAALTLARIRLDTLAEAAVLPLRQNDVARHPWLGSLLPPEAMALLAQQQMIDPIGLLLIVAALACLLAYLLASEFMRPGRGRHAARLALIWAIILLTVFASSLKLTLLRQQSGPASYSHDGGVIQTEATIDYLLAGRNPYVEDYTQTPMAEWGIDEFRTALYHYPYLPWTFLFSAPFKLASEAWLGWYDQRFVYLLLFALTLILATGLTVSAPRQRLLLMLLGLNPLLGSDLIFGQNDSFVLAWIVISLFLWRQGLRRPAGRTPWQVGAAVAFGLACASKPTAWFLAPFYFMLLAGGDPRDLWRRPAAWAGRALRAGWPALATALAIIGPYFVWQPAAMIDDVWRWSAGTSDTAYQIWGWGASNLLLAAGWVSDRFAYWPFWAPELAVGGVLLAALLKKQAGANTPARVLWGYGLWLLAFFFVSRFLNENYLSFILAILTLGALADDGMSPPATEVTAATATALAD
ncbi:MAG: hypothetical protein BWY52_01206 [Chloroflexi bacterium ADurb.Bin325]|nr:MAG: hypothetical protein BWY52_01206 [Chloroflexi bacterium ADurb.Bin325]